MDIISLDDHRIAKFVGCKGGHLNSCFHISHHISIHIIHSKIVILFDVHAENNIRERSLTMELVLIVEIVNKCKLVYVAWLSSFDLDSCA
jgi:hypothetical protein